MIFAIASVILLGSMVGTQAMWTGGFVLLSEYPTWPILAVAFTLALTNSRKPHQLVAIGALLGIALTFRGNQLPGITVIMIIALGRALLPPSSRGLKSRSFIVAGFLLAPAGLIASLPGLHNLYFGGKWVPLQTSLPLPVNFPLPPIRLLEIGTDPTVMTTLLDQLGGVLVFTDQLPTNLLTVTVRLIQLVFMIAVFAGLFHRYRGLWRITLIVIVPIAFLIPHIFVQVFVYYPRHIVAGYYMGSIAILAMASVWLANYQSHGKQAYGKLVTKL